MAAFHSVGVKHMHRVEKPFNAGHIVGRAHSLAVIPSFVLIFCHWVMFSFFAILAVIHF